MTYVLNPTQKQQAAIDYLSPSSDIKVVLYGGAAGGGKTWLGCAWHIIRRLKYPNTTGLIGRSELKDLKLTTMVKFWELCADMGLKAGVHYKYNDQMSTIQWSNGSKTILAEISHRPSDPDYNYLGSYLLCDAFVDEAAGVPGRGIEVLLSRIRENLVGGVPKLLLTCNPSSGYLKNTFYTPWKNGQLHESRAFVPALLSDNSQMKDREVYEQTLRMMSERDRKRLLDGDWDFDDAPDRIFEHDAMHQMFNDSEPTGEGFITCDPAAMGNDRTVIMIWKGLHCVKILEHVHKYPHEVAAILRELSQTYGVPLNNVVVDSDGLGIGVKGLLKCREFLNGSSAVDKEHYSNLKSECFFKLSELVKLNKVHFTDHSHRDNIIKELDLVRDASKEDKKKSVTPKDEIKRTLGRSPDYADCVMMRMFFELRPNYGKYSF